MTDYTKYSYTDLVAAITQAVQNSPGFGNAYNSSVGQSIIQLIAQLTDQLAYALERRSQENFLTTAQLQSSIWALASSIGYRPNRTISASGYLDVQLITSSGVPIGPVGTVTVPQYTQWSYGLYNFVNAKDIVINPGQSSATTQCLFKEGLVTTTQYTPSLGPSTSTSPWYDTTNPIITLTNYTVIENTSIIVSDADGYWYDVTQSINEAAPIGAISFAKATDRVYDIKVNANGLMVVFGDGTTGAAPSLPLTISYINSSGTAVNIQTIPSLPGQYFTVTGENLVFDNSTPANGYNYQAWNITPLDGAEASETIAQIQQHAPDFVRSADRAVTNADYSYWAVESGIGGIVDAATYGQQEVGPAPYQMNNSYVTYLTNEGTAMDQENLDLLRSYMAQLMVMTTYLVLQAATIVPVQIIFRVQPNNAVATPTNVFYQLIETGIAKFFSFKNGSLGSSVNLSDITQYFMNYQTVNNNVNVNAAQWVTIDAYCLQPLYSTTAGGSTIQQVAASANVYTATIIAGSTGNTYELVINGTGYSYVQAGGDTADTIATHLAAALPSGIVNAVVSNNVVTITTAIENTAFTLTNAGTTTSANNVVAQSIQLPQWLFPGQNTNAVNLVFPGSVQLLNMDTGAVVATDNGSGSFASGTVNYLTAFISIPIQAVGNYFISYLQNTDSNMSTNNQSALQYLPAPLTWTPNTNITAGTYVYPVATAVGGGSTSPVFVAQNSGTTGATEPSWSNTAGTLTTDNAGPLQIVWRSTYGFSSIKIM